MNVKLIALGAVAALNVVLTLRRDDTESAILIYFFEAMAFFRDSLDLLARGEMTEDELADYWQDLNLGVKSARERWEAAKAAKAAPADGSESEAQDAETGD